MRTSHSRIRKYAIGAFAWLFLLVAGFDNASADQRVVLKSGLALQGFLQDLPSLKKNALVAGGQGAARPILLVDDGLRRVYVHRRGMVAGPPQEVRGFQRTIDFKQDVTSGTDVQIVGDILAVSKFNAYGHRTITMRGPKGEVIDIVQGITEINAVYAKVEALKAKPAYEWDMRISTRSLTDETLQNIFRGRMDQDDIKERLDVVRFFIDAERYRAAEEELVRAMRAFPDELADMGAQLVGIIQRQAAQLLDEAALRAKAGQLSYAKRVYERFPMNAVGRTKREEVKVAYQNLLDAEKDVEKILVSLEEDLSKLPADRSAALRVIFDEIKRGLSPATLPRLSDYTRLRGAENVALDSRVALAISGWLMGPGSGEANLVVAESLVQVRDLVAEYLGTADAVRRDAIIELLKGMEGSQAEYIDRLLPFLEPVKDWPANSADAEIEGLHRIGILAGDEQVRTVARQPDYIIQLPPEYDPLREYPCLLVLAPPGALPEQELSWWAGDYFKELGARNGYATRHGYIVVSPLWYRPGQRFYEFTPREHDKVLAAMRHAMRHASIDSDRIFLAGHGEGATAAWDIALSHPEHWAGMISINGEPSKTMQHYYHNAKTVPMYFVMGDSAGPAPAPLVRMGTELDNLMHVRHDVTVVMYRGRGREDFYEEIPTLFEWMNAPLHVRREIPTELDHRTMRTGDQYFWWMELGPLKPLIDLNPILWDKAAKRIVTGEINATIGGGNTIRVNSLPSEGYTLWLRPGMGIELNETVVVRGKGASVPVRINYDGEVKTLLEDTRQRADRKRPFWARVDFLR
ncbi:MAG: alpha/beta hydrolase [Planctomycetota bacterium]